jgi:hypothetical protein
MTEQDETVDDRLERLARATSSLRARPGLSDRVMLAVQSASRPGWWDSVVLSARAGFVVAVVAAAAAVALAVQSDWAVTEASAVAYGAVEVGW